jgi:histidyl-tRNA synthetase
MADKGLARLFYTTNIFIFEETGAEAREKWQCGAELIGAASPLADTELISLSMEVLQSLGIKGVELRLSHAGLIKALLAKLGLSPEEQTRVFDQILDGNLETLAELRMRSPELGEVLPSFLNLKGKSSGFLKNLKALGAQNLTEIRPHFDNFMDIVNYLETLGYDYQIDMASGAGFEYYTGMIFQVFDGEEKIGGGGRYDDLIPAMGGKPAPACGFALYIDRLMKLAGPKTLAPAVSSKILVSIKTGESVSLKELFVIASQLRGEGYVTEIDLADHKPSGLRWLLEVEDKVPRFILTDLSMDSRYEARNIGDVLKLLEAESADKNSPA